ncbi:MAG: SGNH/GDSL hydrolase family protein [Candidatus Aegiribacteria sp.]
MSKRNPVLARLIILFGCGATLLILHALITSRSSQGAVLGQWSPAVTGLIVLFTLIFLTGITAAVNRSVLARGEGLFRKVPNIAGGLMAVFLPVLLFLVWFLFPFPLFDRTGFTIGIFILAFVPGLLFISFQEGRRLRRTITGTLMLTVSLAISLIVADVILRILLPGSIFDPRFGLRPHQRVELQVNLPGITPGGMLTTNKWGFRGEEPPRDWDEYLTIVTIGGSTTANYYLDDSLTWSYILQQELRRIDPEVWVGNAGIPRHSAETHALFVKEVLSSIRPDIALFLVGANDMGPFLRGSPSYMERLPDSGLRPWLFRRSMILQLLYRIKKIHIEGAEVITGTVDPYYSEEELTVEEEPLPDDLHDILQDPDFYRDRIRTIISECRALEILPVFMTQPILYDDSEHWRSVLACQMWTGEGQMPISAASYWRMLQTLNSDLKEVCREENVEVIDLASRMPSSEEYFYDTMHMTERGAELAGSIASDRISEYLIEKGILQKQ